LLEGESLARRQPAGRKYFPPEQRGSAS